MLVSASLATPSTSRASRASTGTGGPAVTSRTSSPPMPSAQAASARSAASSGCPSSGEAASPSSVSRASARASLAAALASAIPAGPGRLRAGLAPGGVQVHLDADQPLGQRVVHLGQQPVALRRRGLGPGPFLGRLVHPGVGQRDRGVLGEQAEQFGVVGPEGARVIPAEHDARADDAPAPFQRHPDDPAQRRPFLRRDVAAGHVGIAGEPDRPAARHHGAGHPLGQREDPAGLAGHADVGLFAVGAGRLVHTADRPGVAAEQFCAAAQDPLQQRAQGELAGQVLGDGDQAGGTGGRAAVAVRRPRIEPGPVHVFPVPQPDAAAGVTTARRSQSVTGSRRAPGGVNQRPGQRVPGPARSARDGGTGPQATGGFQGGRSPGPAPVIDDAPAACGGYVPAYSLS